ncbi:protease inhibitor I42 family protein [Snuella sedimenti]|uniref:Protease inhibitor I42 family protein n=1 Tax=Snuella sedimenti TaxID=2798802 RepID=A0A8J7J5C3_9FLAO|nr:protease inhibitor I42 family protein [Snuella sedimenti]MBJ6368978.1 protease inhibitor I42 family protein [Snuella sedimenti]
MLSAHILKYSLIANFFWLSIACNNHKKYVNNDPLFAQNNDTLVFNGCQESIKVAKGSIVELQLEAVPVIGYEWIQKDSSTLLKAHKKDILKYIELEQANFQVLYFEAKRSGTETILLEYKRVFEKEIKKTCTINIKIY